MTNQYFRICSSGFGLAALVLILSWAFNIEEVKHKRVQQATDSNFMSGVLSKLPGPFKTSKSKPMKPQIHPTNSNKNGIALITEVSRR
jgi:hypothetical protein